MRRILGVLVAGVCLAWGSAAYAYQLVEVLGGGTLLVKDDEGREIHLELSGVWVPAPPSPGTKGDYLGEEARRAVEDLLMSRPAFIKEVTPPEPGQTTTIEVRVRVGKHGEDDLAVLLAEAGYGLVNRSTTADPDHLEAIYRAERKARRSRRGMHDGGFESFARHSRGKVLDLGIGTLAAHSGPRRGGGLQRYLTQQVPGQQARAGGANGIHNSGVEAIHDWGSRMGLPPDSSSRGR